MENASRIGRKTSPNSLSKERLRLWLKLLKASKWVEAELRERLRIEFDTTLPRFDVMAALQRHGDGLTMSELVRRTEGLQRQRDRHRRPVGRGRAGCADSGSQ